MRTSPLPVTAVIAALALFPRAARAGDSELRVGAGGFDAIKPHNRAIEFGLQYRAGFWSGPLHPIVGAMATTDGALHFHAGVSLDLALGEHFRVRPSFAPGLYHRGQGTDLGSAVEFRSGLELGYQIDPSHRLGVELYHLSNAGIGSKNPGEESIQLTLAFGL